jgi:hypothetical protein
MGRIPGSYAPREPTHHVQRCRDTASLASPKPLYQLDPEEETQVAERAVRLARVVAHALGDNFLNLTADPFPHHKDAAVGKERPDTPEWIRLPKKGACLYTGMSRSKLCSLIIPCAANNHRPPVRSVCLRALGAARGVRLISYDSLMDYLNSQSV